MLLDVQRKSWPTLREVGCAAERLIVFFPVVVTVLASVGLLMGGSCAAWQWWGALLGTLAVGIARRAWLGCGLFIVFLSVVWLVAGVCVADNGGVDTLTYHLPAIRLLMAGWNPVFASTPEALSASMGVDPAELRLWHVLAMHKGTWVFNAVACLGMRAALCVQFPLFPFLVVLGAGQVWRMGRGAGLWARVLAAIALWLVAPGYAAIADCAVMLGAVALLAAMM